MVSRRDMIQAIGVVGMSSGVGVPSSATLLTRTNERTVFEGGDGSEANPYQIATVDQLQSIEENKQSNYELIDDVDVSATDEFVPIGHTKPGFSGTISGNGYEIHDLELSQPNDSEVGLFSTVYDARIEGLSLSNTQIEGGNNVGAIAGSNVDSEIVDCSATGAVAGDWFVGGLVGDNGGLIDKSQSECDVSCNAFGGSIVGQNFQGEVRESYAMGDVTGESDIGGLVGSNESGSIEASYTTGTVSGESFLGGVSGSNFQGTIRESYAIGKVDSTRSRSQYVGGVSGSNESGTIATAYWDTAETGQDESEDVPDAHGLTTEEMTGEAARENMDGFDFDETWKPTALYPILFWQNETPLDESSLGENGSGDDESPGIGIVGTALTIGGAGYLLSRVTDQTALEE